MYCGVCHGLCCREELRRCGDAKRLSGGATLPGEKGTAADVVDVISVVVLFGVIVTEEGGFKSVLNCPFSTDVVSFCVTYPWASC